MKDKDDRLKTRHIDLGLGERLRDIREAMGLSRAVVADRLRVSVARIQDYEDGERIPASRLWQFCSAYGVEVRDLFEGLPVSVGPVGEPIAEGVAEEGAAFDNPAADADVRAIAEAAIELSPVERRLALAALRGMGQKRLKTVGPDPKSPSLTRNDENN